MTQPCNLILFAAHEQLIMTGVAVRFFLDTAKSGEIREGKHPLADRGPELFAGEWEKAHAAPREIAEPAEMNKGER